MDNDIRPGIPINDIDFGVRAQEIEAPKTRVVTLRGERRKQPVVMPDVVGSAPTASPHDRIRVSDPHALLGGPFAAVDEAMLTVRLSGQRSVTVVGLQDIGARGAWARAWRFRWTAQSVAQAVAVGPAPRATDGGGRAL